MDDIDQDGQLEQDPAAGDAGAATEDHGPGGRRFAGLVSWLVSGAMHATALMIMISIVFISREDPIDTPPVHVTLVPEPPQRQPEKKDVEFKLITPKVDLNLETKSEVEAPITMEKVEVAERPSSEDDTPTEALKGREEAVASSEMGSTAAFMAIGAGGGGSGMFGNRTKGGRKRMTSILGGSHGSERAVEGALTWFRRHQSPDGHWDAERYFANCSEEGKCEPGSLMGYPAAQVNTALTGYAVLCFLGAGYDHRSPSTYVRTVKRGIDWLVSIQKPDGCLGERNYEHAIATMALAEAYAMTSDPDLRIPAQKGVDLILARQNQDPKAPAGSSAGAGLGWDYLKPSERNDASVTGWNVMALKSAYAAGLSVKGGLESSKRWLEEAWQANNDGKAGRADWRKVDIYHDETVFSYTWPTGAAAFEDKGFGHRNMAPVAMACAVFLGHHAGDPMLETLANWVAAHQTPTAYPCNTYYMYYDTMGMFQVGGDKWRAWNAVARDMLVGAQRTDEGCMRGSWDWKGTQFHGSEIGRVLSTAYCTLCLEVYYRLALVEGKKVKGL